MLIKISGYCIPYFEKSGATAETYAEKNAKFAGKETWIESFWQLSYQTTGYLFPKTKLHHGYFLWNFAKCFGAANRYTVEHLLNKNPETVLTGPKQTCSGTSYYQFFSAKENPKFTINVQLITLDNTTSRKIFMYYSSIIHEFKRNDISGNLLTFLTGFLRNRKQRFILDRQSSPWANINVGVPRSFHYRPTFIPDIH